MRMVWFDLHAKQGVYAFWEITDHHLKPSVALYPSNCFKFAKNAKYSNWLTSYVIDLHTSWSLQFYKIRPTWNCSPNLEPIGEGKKIGNSLTCKREPKEKDNEAEKRVQQKQLLMAEDQCTKSWNVNAPVWVWCAEEELLGIGGGEEKVGKRQGVCRKPAERLTMRRGKREAAKTLGISGSKTKQRERTRKRIILVACKYTCEKVGELQAFSV